MTESSNNSTVTLNIITDSAGVAWGIAPSAASGGQVTKNGVVDTTTSHVTQLVYSQKSVFQQNSSGLWWQSTGSSWNSASGDPRTTAPTTPTKTPTTTIPTATSTESADGTTVSAVGAAAIIDKSGAKWTLVTSASSGNQIAVNGTADTTTSNVSLLLYKNHVIWQQNSAGGWWSKTKSSDTWAAGSDPRIVVTPTTPGSVSPPAQATQAGYTHLAFDCEFTDASDVSATQGKLGKFYTHCPNYGSSGSGSYSINNSLAVIQAGAGTANTLSTVNTGDNPVLSTPGNIKSDTGNGIAFQYGYIEASISIDFNGSGSWWPAFWSWPIEQIGGSPYHNGNDCAEFDFLEVDSNHNVYCSMHNWSGAGQFWPQQTSTPPQTALNKNSGAYNIYGFLWTPTQMTWYFNNTPGVTINTASAISVGYSGGDSGPASRVLTAPNICHNFLILGTGTGWPMTVDWVRVWQ